MKKSALLILIVIFSLPSFVAAQSNRFEEQKGNRNILTVEEAKQIGEEPKQPDNKKVLLVFGVLVMLGVVGYATTQLVGMNQKPKLKDDN